jgi:hypothetical protein
MATTTMDIKAYISTLVPKSPNLGAKINKRIKTITMAIMFILYIKNR